MARDDTKRLTKPLDPTAPTIAWMPPADGRRIWNKLPAELRDIIFEMAYVPSQPIRPLSKCMWAQKEAELRQGQDEEYWIFYKHAEFYLKDDEVMYHFLIDDQMDGWPHRYAQHAVSIVDNQCLSHGRLLSPHCT
ncbi:hypothetical protein DOTSEDRAFT_28594 [Dothistroma septosporum NZE10]|uniref:Uncharacterized protein n=1 Tax=Dothistroma septosporum (strain NZE10 / CBS 128990) TaxID=675120 RepID=M2Y2B7_DOTSN|nr:hypothetical protein DOTSEDRAFT_28594 [Dothistroma septosporum NZE10]